MDFYIPIISIGWILISKYLLEFVYNYNRIEVWLRNLFSENLWFLCLIMGKTYKLKKKLFYILLYLMFGYDANLDNKNSK